MLGIVFAMAIILTQSSAVASDSASLSTPSCTPSWQIVSSPNAPGGNNRLNGIAAISPNDAWAVGIVGNGNDNPPLMLEWDGTQWIRQPNPQPTVIGWLNAVTAISSDDVWAVGMDTTHNSSLTLAIHWDGSQWTHYSTPNLGAITNGLYGVASTSTDDVWAVGNGYPPSQNSRTQIQHWDGSQWSIVPSPNVGTNNNYLTAITALSANDAWAVGQSNNGATLATLIEHWNGTQWSVVPSPNLGSTNNLNTVVALSANDVWAAGEYSSGGVVRSFTLHWDGNQWNIIATPNVGTGNNHLTALAALSPNNVWAVGSYAPYQSPPYHQTLSLHWDGNQWSIVPSPNDTSLTNVLQAVQILSTGEVWAAGWYDSDNGQRTLIERYSCPPPTVTGTPPTATSTATPTITPTRTHILTCTVTPTLTGLAGPPYVPTNTFTNTPTNTPTDTPTATPPSCGPGANYTISQATGALIGGATDTGNHCDDCTTGVALPFGFRLYGVTFSNVNVESNGTLQFNSNTPTHDNTCSPTGFSYIIFPHWDSLHTDQVGDCAVYGPGGCGVFTSVSGPVGDRIFTIEWRSVYNNDNTQLAHFEVRLHEASPGLNSESTFDVFYNTIDQHGSSATVGVLGGQYFAYFECNQANSLASGMLLTFGQPPCISATPTSTITGTQPTRTPTHTPTISRTPTLTPTITLTRTRTISPSPTFTTTPTFTPTFGPCVLPIIEDFESGTLGLFNSAGSPGWSAVTTDQHSGLYSAFAPDVPTVSDQRLTLSDSIAVPLNATQATLSFWHHFNLEPGGGGFAFDGGVLELSTNLGQWSDPQFISGGYNRTVFTGLCAENNPLGGRAAWSGDSLGWQQVIVDLSAYRGQRVYFRFRLGTDETGSTPGWWIDDVVVSFTQSVCFSPTPTPTATPSSTPILIGHVNWDARPPQPHQLQSLPITLTLKSRTTEVNYSTQLTDQCGYFTLTLDSLPNGTYAWRADDSAISLHSPNYLSNAGVVKLTGAHVTNIEIGLAKAGDSNNDDAVNISDFIILKPSFGFGCGNPLYDNRADFTGDCLVNVADFSPLKRNFGQSGSPPIRR